MAVESDISILVVDDVQTMRTQISGLFELSGFKNIRVASNGLEACQLLLSQPFQLIIADWQMNPMNGLEFVHFVRSHPALNGIPFIMLTAETTKEKVVEAIRAGIDDYIVKPLTQDHILLKVGIVLKKRNVI